jgi:hypothetical protein
LRKNLEQIRRDLARAVAPYPEAETLRHHLRRLIRRLDINCVLDVGAHVGQYVYLLREEIGFKGHIISFEPTAAFSAEVSNACFPTGGVPNLGSRDTQAWVFAHDTLLAEARPLFADDHDLRAVRHPDLTHPPVDHLADGVGQAHHELGRGRSRR